MHTQAERRRRPDEGYLYDRVTAQVLGEDLSFSDAAPGAGDLLPAFDLPTTTGDRLRSDDLLARAPVLVVPGSLTCPMTASSMPILKRLHVRFGDRIAFVTLYVREAHPGEDIPQPRSFEQKLEHARILQERDRLPWPVVVDDLAGSLHRVLDGKPNPAFLAEPGGRIVFRALWAGDRHALAAALEAVARGEAPPHAESNRRMVPMAQGMGEMRSVLRRAGRQAERDVWRSAPPMAATAWGAGLFRSLPPEWRPVAALAGLGLLCGALGALLAARRHD